MLRDTTYILQKINNIPVSYMGPTGYKINGRPVAIGDVKQRYGDILCHIGRHRGDTAANLAVARMRMHTQLSGRVRNSGSLEHRAWPPC